MERGASSSWRVRLRSVKKHAHVRVCVCVCAKLFTFSACVKPFFINAASPPLMWGVGLRGVALGQIRSTEGEEHLKQASNRRACLKADEFTR